MGLLGKIVKKNKSFKQSDNKGIFHNDVDIATEYWIKRKAMKKLEPFLLYKFTDETDAVRALLEIDCIKVAMDTEEIICTEPLIYGYYPVDNEEYEAVLCGSSMNITLFNSAKKSFEDNNGQKINEMKPAVKITKPEPVIKKSAVSLSAPVEKINKVKASEKPKPEVKAEAEFVSEEKKMKNGQEMTIRIYKAVNSRNAIAFLETKLVTKKNIVLIVKTPHGIYGRNYSGIYKVQKHS